MWLKGIGFYRKIGEILKYQRKCVQIDYYLIEKDREEEKGKFNFFELGFRKFERFKKF